MNMVSRIEISNLRMSCSVVVLENYAILAGQLFAINVDVPVAVLLTTLLPRSSKGVNTILQ